MQAKVNELAGGKLHIEMERGLFGYVVTGPHGITGSWVCNILIDREFDFSETGIFYTREDAEQFGDVVIDFLEVSHEHFDKELPEIMDGATFEATRPLMTFRGLDGGNEQYREGDRLMPYDLTFFPNAKNYRRYQLLNLPFGYGEPSFLDVQEAFNYARTCKQKHPASGIYVLDTLTGNVINEEGAAV